MIILFDYILFLMTRLIGFDPHIDGGAKTKRRHSVILNSKDPTIQI